MGLLFSATVTPAGQPDIHYVLGMSEPQTHLFEVKIELKDMPRDEMLDLVLPVWRPGRYVILDFANGIQEFSAVGDGKNLDWRKTDKTTWHIETRGAKEVTATYKVYADEFNLRTRGLNDSHAFVDESSVFMYSEKFRKLPVTLTVRPYKNWHVTTGLESSDGHNFTAPDYDYFIDCPLEIGNQQDYPFVVDGVSHVLSISGEGNWNADTLIRDLSKVVNVTKAFWGSVPYKRYVFLLECMPNSGGATEHINSTIMQTAPFIFKNPDSYRGLLVGTATHEYFHTWNVKQLRPKGIDPYDFTKENYSQELWIAEGMTTYYAELLGVRAGFTPVAKYLDLLGSAVSSDRQRPGNNLESVADASFNAWIGGTQHWYNSESDIYEKGAMVSALLDLEIRHETSNKFSLDDVMREMYKLFPLSGGGYTLADFRRVITNVTGWDCEDFFRDFIFGTKPLKWEDELLAAGLQVNCTDTVAKPWVGVSLYDAGASTRINRIVAGSPAYESGLSTGDEVLALNGYRIRSNSFSERIGELQPGDKITLTIFQNDQIRTVQLVLGKAPKTNYKVTQVGTPTDLQRAVFEGWLETKWKTN